MKILKIYYIYIFSNILPGKRLENTIEILGYVTQYIARAIGSHELFDASLILLRLQQCLNKTKLNLLRMQIAVVQMRIWNRQLLMWNKHKLPVPLFGLHKKINRFKLGHLQKKLCYSRLLELKLMIL